MFDTKIAIIVRNDLAMWQRLNVVAFLATGIPSIAPEVMGELYENANGHKYSNMSGQPMLIFEGDLKALQTAHQKGIDLNLDMLPYVHAMFATSNDEDNRRIFRQDDPDNLNLVGLALKGPKKLVDKAIKGLKLHK